MDSWEVDKECHEYIEYLHESQQDASTICNSTITFMMSRADMINCSPVMCLVVMELLVKQNLDEHIRKAAQAAVRMSKRDLDADYIERVMTEQIEDVRKILKDSLRIKEVSLDG